MIKILKDQTSKSYWKGSELYYTQRNNSYSIKVFGITVWRKGETFNDNPGDDNSIGYKKK